jgi:hypothetical protein
VSKQDASGGENAKTGVNHEDKEYKRQISKLVELGGLRKILS